MLYLGAVYAVVNHLTNDFCTIGDSMTQEVQPLTWSKRTNIEEHQQFFSKINEIIGNLAPTVGEVEQAIAQATAAITSANDAIATANAASAAASAAASQAQTAASTVADYDARLTAAEGDIDTNTADITALEGRESDYLKKTGAAQTVTSHIMVPTTATGLRDTQIANGTRIQNDLDAYAPMIRNTGNQTKSGELTLTDRLFMKSALNYKPVLCLSRPDETKPWRKLYTAQGGNMCSFTLMLQERTTVGIMTIYGYGNSNQTAVWNLAPAGITKANYLVTVTAGSVIEVWHKQNDAYDTLVACVLIEWNAANDNVLSDYVHTADFSVEYTEPVAGDYTQYITPA